MARWKPTSDQDMVLRNLAQQYPRPFLIKVFRLLPGGGRQQILAAANEPFFRITSDELTTLDAWVAQHPLIGPGHAYHLQVFAEDANGKPGKTAKFATDIPLQLSPTDAAEIAAAGHAQAADARERVARQDVVRTLNDLTRTAGEEAPRLVEAFQMSQSPDPNVQAASGANASQAIDRLAQALGGFQQSAMQLTQLLLQPRPVATPLPSPAVPAPSPMGMPMPSPVAPASPWGSPAMPAAGMPQLVNLPGYPPMALVGGQLVPISGMAKPQEDPTAALVREFLARQQMPGAVPPPTMDPALREELRQVREQAQQAQREAQQARLDADRRALEAERKADEARHAAELQRIQAEADAKLATLRAEIASSSKKNDGEDSSHRFLGLLQQQQQQHQQMMMEMQRQVADREARYQEQINALNQRQIEMLQEQASQGPGDQVRAISQSMGDIVGLATQTMAQAARMAAMGGGGAQQGQNPPVWLPMAEKLIDHIAGVGALLAQGATGAPPATPQQPQQQPAQQLPPPPTVEVQPMPESVPSPSAALPPAERQAPAAEQGPAQTPPRSLDAARLVEQARQFAKERKLADAFKALDRAFETDPQLLAHGGTDDLRDLRAGQAILAGFVPEGVTAQEVLQALTTAKGPTVVMRAIRLYQEMQRAASAPAPTPDSAASRSESAPDDATHQIAPEDAQPAVSPA